MILLQHININGSEQLHGKELALFEPTGDHVNLKADEDSILLVMAGEPINEPIADHGSFVMNTHEEINKAINDFNGGRF
ncbi:MAG: hypothetical protein HOP36_01830 [Methyloglobulus sp.]|nr:hypothetical protein [Methyloglobulus sp.]